MSRSRILWLAALAVLLMAVGTLGANLRNHLGEVTLLLHMEVDTAGAGQAFTRERDGYTEANSVRFDLAHRAGRQPYLIELHPDDPLGAVRVDPGSGKGRVRLTGVQFSWRGTQFGLSGAPLKQAVRPLKQLEEVPVSDGVALRSTGDDPFFEIRAPDELTNAMERRAHLGFGLLATSLAGLLVLAWSVRREALHAALRCLSTGGWPLSALAAVAAFVLLSSLGAGCDGMCSPRGLGYGLLLVLGSLGMAAIGQVALKAMGIEHDARPPRLFLSLLTGQALLVVYVAVRSVIHAWSQTLPITAAEIVLLAAAAAIYVAHGMRAAPLPVRASRSWWPLELAVLTVVCVVVGDRELPRIVMLSSDPDTHAYFARMLEVRGGIPWSGGDVFNYPSGTATLGFLWAKLAFLDVRNAVTALPLLQAFFAAALVAEGFAVRTRDTRVLLGLFLAALGITAAAFLVPLYANYAHMEGAGRQMAIALLAVVPAALLSQRAGSGAALAGLMLLALFALAALNPINLVVPMVLLATFGLQQVLVHRRIGWWVLVPIALIPLLLLDPYYWTLIAGAGTPESRFTVDGMLPVKPLPSIMSEWGSALSRGPGDFLAGNTRFLPAQAPLFVASAVPLLLILGWIRRWTLYRVLRGAAVALFAIVSLWVADALFDTLLGDRRFYLLAPYYWLALAQLKILLVTTLTLAVILAAHLRRWPWPAWAGFTLVAITIAALSMSRTQDFMDRPRYAYCGSLGCAARDDLAVLEEFELLAKKGALRPGKVLLPNSLHEAHREKWIFPVTGARALPFFDGPSPAFYYYQGDPDFTTENYVHHVCERLDRDWLRQQSVTYIFLPQHRGSACVAGMEALVQTERVVVRRGNSMILELH